ncbi:MAG TPA: acetate--CoA ligase family protein [Gaiellaceae bacterium]|jgi:acyl-CoA synthetase (NDP forming)
MSRDLRPLFEPRSLAIVGVSTDPEKWGYWFARDAAKGAHRRAVHLVGRSGGEVHGLPIHRSLRDLPEPPELVVLSVPASALAGAVDEALAAGARALVAIAAGLGELGPEGAEQERAIVARVREAGAVMLGPNCLGVFDAAAELDLASNPLPPGPVGLVSQSGNIALETGLLLADLGLGFSRLASVGNQADLDVTDVLRSLAAHDGTRAIGVYCEDFRDGRAFAEAARTAGKPVVLLTVGRTGAARRAARSHTGALTSDLAAVDAACRAAGVHRVETPRELVDALQALLGRERPSGRRVAVVGDGGGYGAVASDLLGATGLELPVLGEATQAALRATLPPTAATANPVDLAGAGEQDTFSFARTTRTLLESGDVDAVLFTAYFGGYSSQSDELREREEAVAAELAAAAHATGRPLVVHTMYWDAPPARLLRRSGIAVYRAVESAVAALAALAAEEGRLHEPLPRVPAPAAPVAATGYADARAALAAAGVPFGAARTAATRDDAVAAAGALGYPVVLKALGALHKSDGGGVVVGLGDADAVAAAADALAAETYSVEAMEDTAAGVELLAGARWDARFGPVVVVGAGGIHAELFRDTAAALAPVDADRAAAMIRSLACAPLLLGARGRPPLDVAAAADAVAALSRFAAEHPELAELEVNPLLVRERGAVGLDARLVAASIA